VPVHTSELLTQVFTGNQYAGNGTAGIKNETKPTGFFFQMPPRKEWIGLTDEERNEMVNKIQHDQFTRQRDLIGSTQIITEMYLKERNT